MEHETYSPETLLEKNLIDQQSFVELKTLEANRLAKNEEEVTKRHKEEEETKRRKDKEEEETKRRKEEEITKQHKHSEEEATKRTTATSGSCTFNILLS